MQDLTGVQFGKLLVRGPSQDVLITKNGRIYPKWDCICECGNIGTYASHHLRAGRKSCGCLSPGPTVFNPTDKLLRTYQKAAVQKHHEWALSLDQFKQLVKSACHYCGVPPSNEQTF